MLHALLAHCLDRLHREPAGVITSFPTMTTLRPADRFGPSQSFDQLLAP